MAKILIKARLASSSLEDAAKATPEIFLNYRQVAAWRDGEELSETVMRTVSIAAAALVGSPLPPEHITLIIQED